MKKVINRKTYNTETSKLIDKKTYGYFGDPAGYEESLYETRTGNFFLCGIGGIDSKYAEETVVPLSGGDAEKWQAE